MRAKILLVPAIVLGASLFFSNSNAAANDVFVDLSVLDSLGEATSPAINSGPLFPIVKKAESRKPVKKSVAERKTKPAAKKKTVKKVSAPAHPEKLNIPAKPEIKVEVKNPEHVEVPVKSTGNVPEELKNSPFAVAPVENGKEEISAAPVTPVEIKTEPLADAEKEPVIMEPINGATPLRSPSEKEESGITSVPESLFEKDEVSSSAETVGPIVPLIAKEAPVAASAPQKVLSPLSGEIVFAPDSYELTDDDKVRLDALVASFENPSANKIAIYAFNIDDGKDIFRKKRLSLNRAVEVRSYLLGKGYKNFSIKVVNIDAPEDKENKVIVEELK